MSAAKLKVIREGFEVAWKPAGLFNRHGYGSYKRVDMLRQQSSQIANQ